MSTESAEASGPALTGQVCGTCASGLHGQYPNEIDCQLGWDRQDGTLRPLLDGRFEWVAIPQGHGELPLPVATPTASCAAVLGGGHPGWTARA